MTTIENNQVAIETSNIRYVYVRQPRKNITVAYKFDDDAKALVFNFAKCSPRDTFTRQRGRTVAAGRLLTQSSAHPNSVVSYEGFTTEDGKLSNKKVVNFLFSQFVNGDTK